MDIREEGQQNLFYYKGLKKRGHRLYEEEGGKRRRIFLPLPFLSNLGLAST